MSALSNATCGGSFEPGDHRIKLRWLATLLLTVSFIGKAAIGGAGAMLAVLGAINLVHTWTETGAYLPYFVTAGALAGAIYGVRHRRDAV